MAEKFDKQISTLEQKYEDIGKLTNIKTAKDQIEDTRKDLYNLFANNLLSTSEEKKLTDMSLKLDETIKTCQAKIDQYDEGKDTTTKTSKTTKRDTIEKLQKQKETIDKVVAFLERVKASNENNNYMRTIQTEQHDKELTLKNFVTLKETDKEVKPSQVSAMISDESKDKYIMKKLSEKTPQTYFSVKYELKNKSGEVIGIVKIVDDKNSDKNIKFTPSPEATRDEDITIDLALFYTGVISLDLIADSKNKDASLNIRNTKKIKIKANQKKKEDETKTTDELKQAQDKVVKAENELAQANEKLAKAQEENAKAINEAKDQAEVEVRKAQEVAKKAQDELTRVNAELTDAQEELKKAQNAEKNPTKETKTQTDEKVAQVQTELDKADKELIKTQDELKIAQEELAKAQEEAKKANEELKEAQQKTKATQEEPTSVNLETKKSTEENKKDAGDIMNQLNQGKKLELTDKNGGRFIVYKDGNTYYAASLDDETPRVELSEEDIKKHFSSDKEDEKKKPSTGLTTTTKIESDKEPIKEPTTPKTSTEVKTQTSANIASLFSVDTHLMDKKDLIREAELNRVRDLAEKKYMQSGFLRKIGMFATKGRLERRRTRKEMKQHISNNNFIEQSPLQNRVEGHIGTRAAQDKMGIDDNLITRSDLGSDDTINDIAHQYTMGMISRDQAITQFNTAFAANASLRMGEMTGSDIMTQLDTTPNKSDYGVLYTMTASGALKDDGTIDYALARSALQQFFTTQKLLSNKSTLVPDANNITDEHINNIGDKLKKMKADNHIDQVNENTLRMRVNLIGLKKDNRAAEIEGVKHDTVDKGPLTWIAKKLNIGGLGWAAKAALGVGLGLGGVPALGVTVGVGGLGIVLQRAKSYRNAMKEMAKTQEDAINMGLGELDQRITELENTISQAGRFQKVVGWFGMGRLARATKQKKIITSMQGLRKAGVIQPSNSILTALSTANQENLGPIADALARIDAGHHYQTQFISTADGGRQQTAIQRKQIMDALQAACIRSGLVPAQPTADQWRRCREFIHGQASYQSSISNLSTAYEQVQKDIKSTRGSIARKDAFNYAKVAAGSAAITGIVGGLIEHGVHSGSASIDHTEIPGATTEKITEIRGHTNYDLGKFDEAHSVTQMSGLDQIHNGQEISISAESAVDAARAFSNFEGAIQHAHDVSAMIASSSLNDATKHAFTEALSTSKIDEIMKIAAAAGADEGNQKLVIGRWAEGLEEMAKHLTSHNLTDVTVKDIVFDTDTFSDMAIQASTGGQDVSQRAFGAAIKLIEHVPGGVDKEFVCDFSLPTFGDMTEYSRVGAALPFYNTYAYSGNRADYAFMPKPKNTPPKGGTSKHPDKKSANRWDNKYTDKSEDNKPAENNATPNDNTSANSSRLSTPPTQPNNPSGSTAGNTAPIAPRKSRRQKFKEKFFKKKEKTNVASTSTTNQSSNGASGRTRFKDWLNGNKSKLNTYRKTQSQKVKDNFNERLHGNKNTFNTWSMRNFWGKSNGSPDIATATSNPVTSPITPINQVPTNVIEPPTLPEDSDKEREENEYKRLVDLQNKIAQQSTIRTTNITQSVQRAKTIITLVAEHFGGGNGRVNNQEEFKKLKNQVNQKMHSDINQNTNVAIQDIGNNLLGPINMAFENYEKVFDTILPNGKITGTDYEVKDDGIYHADKKIEDLKIKAAIINHIQKRMEIEGQKSLTSDNLDSFMKSLPKEKINPLDKKSLMQIKDLTRLTVQTCKTGQKVITLQADGTYKAGKVESINTTNAYTVTIKYDDNTMQPLSGGSAIYDYDEVLRLFPRQLEERYQKEREAIEKRGGTEDNSSTPPQPEDSKDERNTTNNKTEKESKEKNSPERDREKEQYKDQSWHQALSKILLIEENNFPTIEESELIKASKEFDRNHRESYIAKTNIWGRRSEKIDKERNNRDKYKAMSEKIETIKWDVNSSKENLDHQAWGNAYTTFLNSLSAIGLYDKQSGWKDLDLKPWITGTYANPTDPVIQNIQKVYQIVKKIDNDHSAGLNYENVMNNKEKNKELSSIVLKELQAISLI